MSAPQLFSNGEFELPVIPAADSFRVNATVIAHQLGFSVAKDLVRTLADDEKMLVAEGGKFAHPSEQAVWFITEPGFYKVVGQRNVNVIRDPKVRDAVARFQRWVFHEVIPAMVRSGQATESSLVGTTWSWDDVATEIRQRAGKPALAGSPLSLGHQHARGLRAIAKELLRDLWIESKRIHELQAQDGQVAA